MTQHFPILLILVLFFGALLIAIFGRLGKRVPWMMAVGSTLLAFCLSLALLFEVLEDGVIRYSLGGWAPPIGIELVYDRLSAFISVVILGVSTLVLVHAREPVERENGENRIGYFATALLAVGGFSGIVGTGDLFNLYVFLEISSLASYALIGSGGARSAVAAFRYLILGTIGASFYLLGLGFVFIQTGSLNMADIHNILRTDGLDQAILVGILLMITGTGLKMALLPLHQWLPDAYTYAPATSSSLIAPIGTKVGAYVMIRLVFGVFPTRLVLDQLPLLEIIGILGAIGIVWGSVMAIPQHNLKRMLAYSSVAQIGYIALGIGLGTAFGLIGAVLHILNHACMKACLFLVSSNLESNGKGIEIKGLGPSLRRDMPWSSAAFTVAAISMIGLPPTAGFFSKWYLLLGSFEEDRFVFVAVILLSSLLNAVYFFRILERIYLGPAESEPSDSAQHPTPSFLRIFSPLILGAGLLVLGLGNAIIVTHILEPMLPIAR